MHSCTSKVIPTDMKIHENSHIKNVKYCAKEINKISFTRHILYQMTSIPRLRGSRDLSPYSSSTMWADEDEGVMIIISTKNTP